MLTEKRYELILKLLDEQNSVTVAEIKEKLKISESTIRRDLNALDKAGKLNKVFGGAVAIEAGITTAEPSVAQKKGVNKEEKQLIARYAAALITKDAGTTTGCMIDFITEKSATYVTNAVSHAQKLAAAGFRVYLIGGELKPTTEAVVGNQAILSLETLHFSKAFFGTNGVSLKAGAVHEFGPEDVVCVGVPSYGGRIPSAVTDITDRRPPEAFLRSKNITVA